MSQIANVAMPTPAPEARASSANHSFAIAGVPLTIALVLIAAQLIFASNSPEALNAAAETAVFGIVGP